MNPVPIAEDFAKAAELHCFELLDRDGLVKAYRDLAAWYYAATRELGKK